MQRALGALAKMVGVRAATPEAPPAPAPARKSASPTRRSSRAKLAPGDGDAHPGSKRRRSASPAARRPSRDKSAAGGAPGQLARGASPAAPADAPAEEAGSGAAALGKRAGWERDVRAFVKDVQAGGPVAVAAIKKLAELCEDPDGGRLSVGTESVVEAIKRVPEGKERRAAVKGAKMKGIDITAAAQSLVCLASGRASNAECNKRANDDRTEEQVAGDCEKQRQERTARLRKLWAARRQQKQDGDRKAPWQAARAWGSAAASLQDAPLRELLGAVDPSCDGRLADLHPGHMRGTAAAAAAKRDTRRTAPARPPADTREDGGHNPTRSRPKIRAD